MEGWKDGLERWKSVERTGEGVSGEGREGGEERLSPASSPWLAGSGGQTDMLDKLSSLTLFVNVGETGLQGMWGHHTLRKSLKLALWSRPWHSDDAEFMGSCWQDEGCSRSNCMLTNLAEIPR